MHEDDDDPRSARDALEPLSCFLPRSDRCNYDASPPSNCALDAALEDASVLQVVDSENLENHSATVPLPIRSFPSLAPVEAILNPSLHQRYLGLAF